MSSIGLRVLGGAMAGYGANMAAQAKAEFEQALRLAEMEARDKLRAKDEERQHGYKTEEQNTEIAGRRGLLYAENDLTVKRLKGQNQWYPGAKTDEAGTTTEGMYRLPAYGNEQPEFFSGQTINRSRSGVGGKSVSQWKYDAWLAAHPGDTSGALDFVGGHRTMTKADALKFGYQQAQKENPGAEPADLDTRANTLASSLVGADRPAHSAAPAAQSGPVDATQSISNAWAAIKAGKDREAVKKKLRDHGITPPPEM